MEEELCRLYGMLVRGGNRGKARYYAMIGSQYKIGEQGNRLNQSSCKEDYFQFIELVIMYAGAQSRRTLPQIAGLRFVGPFPGTRDC